VQALFASESRLLIGMVHLPPLPGSPRGCADLNAVLAHAGRDAKVLVAAGFPCLLVENFGDAPFAAEQLAPETIAAMAIVVREIRNATGALVGVNCLRNDASSALAIAAVTGAAFVRVNVHVGVAAADQGWLTGAADRTLRQRAQLGAQVRILADVHVKHAVNLSQPDIALAAEETAYRGGADALIVSGATTGRPIDADELHQVRSAVPDRPLLIGSGATVDNLTALIPPADGVIVGSGLKPGGDPAAPIDPARAAAFADRFNELKSR
jgi:membrane complex biogenesis BtpA family protein